jgi:hypothetical protein
MTVEADIPGPVVGGNLAPEYGVRRHLSIPLIVLHHHGLEAIPLQLA